MNRYDIPEIKIKRFISEMIVTTSAGPQENYIGEIGALQRFLGDDSEQFKKRMASFNALVGYTE